MKISGPPNDSLITIPTARIIAPSIYIASANLQVFNLTGTVASKARIRWTAKSAITFRSMHLTLFKSGNLMMKNLMKMFSLYTQLKCTCTRIQLKYPLKYVPGSKLKW